MEGIENSPSGSILHELYCFGQVNSRNKALQMWVAYMVFSDLVFGFWFCFLSSWTFPMNASEVTADYFLPILLRYTLLPPFNYCESVMMKITTINNALTFYVFFPTKRKIHAELQVEVGSSCCSVSIDKSVCLDCLESSFTSYWDEMEGNMDSSHTDIPQS